ncbi:hypothetical protein [Paramagnetospirillum marisnigri]|nr:hypothetical protein [Paramagnetospirillum marisnigri]
MTSEACGTAKCWAKRVIGVAALVVSVVVIGGTVVGWGIIGVTTLLSH